MGPRSSHPYIHMCDSKCLKESKELPTRTQFRNEVQEVCHFMFLNAWMSMDYVSLFPPSSPCHHGNLMGAEEAI